MTTTTTDAGTDSAPKALAVDDLHAAYGEIQVLHGISFSVQPGEVVALLGTNGAGKTTTLRSVMSHVTGQFRVTKGSISYGSDDVTRTDSSRLTRMGICLVPEGRGIFPNLTVEENLWMWTHARKGTRALIAERAFEQFPVLGKRRKQTAGTLSGGEQQMLALSRALATDPRLLMLDELSMGLAPALVAELYGVVKQIAEQGTSVLLVEQSISAALSIADRVAIVSHGRIERIGRPAEVADEAYDLYLN